jgi:hypothetical protein
MKKNKFDIHAKNLLRDHEEVINTEALWDDVQAELYPKRKKKFAWIWFSASSILALILFAGYMSYVGGSNDSLDIEPKNTIETRLKVENEIASVEIKTESIDKPGLNASKQTIKAVNNAIPKSITTKNSKKSSIVKDKQLPLNKLAASPILHPNTKIEKTIPAKNALISTPTPSKEAAKSNLQKSNPTETNSSAAEILAKTVTKETKQSEPEINDSTPEIKAETNLKKIEPKEEEQTIAPTEEQPKIIALAEKENEEASEESAEEISRKLKKNFSVGVGFRAGISNSLTTLTASDEDAIPLRTLRNESETNLETIDLGIGLLLKHKSRVYLSTGIDYLRAARKLEYNFTDSFSDSIPGIRSIIINPITMDSTFVEGLVARDSTFSINKETYNNLHIINIPVQLGVSLRHEQWSFGIQGGALFNILVNQKGEIFDSESTFYNLATDEKRWFRDNLGVNFQGSALIGYHFSENFQIVGGPSFRSTLTISEAINPVQQSQTGIGLQVAARYWFN